MPYELSRWSLDELMTDASEASIAPYLEDIECAVAELEEMRPHLTQSINEDEFLRALALIERFGQAAARLQSYAVLKFSADTQDQQALALMGRLDDIVTRAYNRMVFFGLWWKGLDDKTAGRLMESAGRLRYYLEYQRLFRPHVLTEPEEKVINIKDLSGASAVTTLYDMITNKFEYTITVDGETKTLTRDALMTFVRHPSASVREAAYRELYRVFGAEAPVLAHIYASRVRDWANENIDLRAFKSPIAVRNLANNIPDAVVDTLLWVCEEEAHVFHRYFKMKAGWLGVDKLRRFDIYAPIGQAPMKHVSYPDAVDSVFDSFGRFAPEFLIHAQRVFDENHIDSEVRPGKRGGAFCYSVDPALAPWVLLNYTGEPREVATLAHELGHAVHSLLAHEHSVLTFHAPLPLAETASVFAEMLLTDKLLESEGDPLVKRDIISHAVDDMYATVLRQAFFVLFEREAHEMVREGRTADEISAAYLENLHRQFGGSVDVDELFRNEWVSIPHLFHTPFYCYAYSFGMLLSLALYQRYKEQGPGFAPTLLRILAHGGSASPNDILTEAGVDMASADFWRGGFRVIEEMIGRLEG